MIGQAGNPFRVRSNELDVVGADLPLGELLSTRVPTEPKKLAVRQAQLEALVRMVPATVGGQFVAAAMVAVVLRDVVPAWELGLWLSLALGLCIFRGIRAYRLRKDREYARRRPADARVIARIVIALAGLWLVPPFHWFPEAGALEQVILLLVSVGLLSVGSVTLVSLPSASLGYIALLGLGNVAMSWMLGGWPLATLSVLYSTILMWVSVTSARRFIAQVGSRYDLLERSELVSLLREFEASGSGGIWELGRDLRLTYVSQELAARLGIGPERLVGKHVRKLIDPSGQITRLSEGTRTLFHHLDNGVPFRDLAVPATSSQTWWSLSGKPVHDTTGNVIGWRGVGSDITDVRLSGNDAVSAARRDPLTGLANRLLVREILEEALFNQLDGREACSLLLVDLDKFKLVNDTLGHAIGDQLLVAVAKRLKSTIGPDAHVGRLGGDEFAVIVRGDQSEDRLGGIAATIIADLSRIFVIGAARLHIGATIGIARGGRDGEVEETLMRNADLALYEAKEEGRGGYAFFRTELYERAERNRLLENDVREALADNALTLAYQPIVDARSGWTVGREALLRWNHPLRGPIPPDEFIPVIEDAGLIHQIGDWVIREACREACGWDPSMRVAVNVSAAQLSGSGLAETVLGALAATGLAPGRLELEVTESIFLGDDLATIASLERLRSLGVKLVLDDFGKGYSSFGYLTRAQFAKIKIEQMFVRGAAAGERDCIAIVGAIVALAKGLGMETTAEGVETDRQAETMRALGCDQMQGYLFGRPVPPEEFRRAADDPPPGMKRA